MIRVTLAVLFVSLAASGGLEGQQPQQDEAACPEYGVRLGDRADRPQ